MKLAISTLVCPQWTLQQIVAAASSAGIRGIDFRGLGDEIDITRLPDFNELLPQTLAMLRAHDLQMPCLQTSVTLVTPPADRWQMMLEEAQRTARLAEASHTRVIRIFGGAVPKQMSRDEAIILGRRHLRQLIKICGQFGCVPLLETHDDWTTAPQILEMIHEFDPQEVGVLWDVEHPWRCGESPADTCAALRRFIRHVHLKDSIVHDGKRLPRLLGHGDLPLLDSLAALRQIGFDGWICLETEKRWLSDDAPNPEQSIPQFAQFMAARE